MNGIRWGTAPPAWCLSQACCQRSWHAANVLLSVFSLCIMWSCDQTRSHDLVFISSLSWISTKAHGCLSPWRRWPPACIPAQTYRYMHLNQSSRRRNPPWQLRTAGWYQDYHGGNSPPTHHSNKIKRCRGAVMAIGQGLSQYELYELMRTASQDKPTSTHPTHKLWPSSLSTTRASQSRWQKWWPHTSYVISDSEKSSFGSC